MVHIIVDDQQAKTITECSGTIEVRDRQGRCLGYISHGFTDEDIAEAKRRLAAEGPRYTTQQVLDHLASLERA